MDGKSKMRAVALLVGVLGAGLTLTSASALTHDITGTMGSYGDVQYDEISCAGHSEETEAGTSIIQVCAMDLAYANAWVNNTSTPYIQGLTRYISISWYKALCTPGQPSPCQFTFASATIDDSQFDIDPLMKSAHFFGDIAGCQIDVAFSSESLPMSGGFFWNNTDPNGQLRAWVYASQGLGNRGTAVAEVCGDGFTDDYADVGRTLRGNTMAWMDTE